MGLPHETIQESQFSQRMTGPHWCVAQLILPNAGYLVSDLRQGIRVFQEVQSVYLKVSSCLKEIENGLRINKLRGL